MWVIMCGIIESYLSSTQAPYRSCYWTRLRLFNVVVLNKQDIVTLSQVEDVMDKVSLINTKAEVIKSSQSQINVMDILHRVDNKELGFESMMLAATRYVVFPAVLMSQRIPISLCHLLSGNRAKSTESQSFNSISDIGRISNFV